MFERLEHYKVDKATAWFDIPELGSNARLKLRPATEANKPYYNAFLRFSGKRVRGRAHTTVVTTDDLVKDRTNNRNLFPKHIIIDWEKVETAEDIDRSEEEKEYIPYTLDHAKELCQKLPDHIFDRMREFTVIPASFYDEDDLLPDSEDLAGN